MEHLFHVDGEPLHVERPDAAFERFGLLRPDAAPSGKSRPPDPLLPANFAIRLRLLCGIGTRAEVLRFLLTMGTRASTSQVAESAAYARRNVEEALNALAEATVITGARQAGRREWWIDRQRWADLLDIEVAAIPRSVDWERLFSALRSVDDWFEADVSTNRTEYIRASTARELIDNIRDDLLALGWPAPPRIDAAGALTVLEDVVAFLLSLLRGRSSVNTL